VPPIQLAAAALDAEKDDSGISAARAVLLVKADVVQLAGVSERSKGSGQRKKADWREDTHRWMV